MEEGAGVQAEALQRLWIKFYEKKRTFLDVAEPAGRELAIVIP